MPENDSEHGEAAQITDAQLSAIKVEAQNSSTQVRADSLAEKEFEALFGLAAIYGEDKARHDQLKLAIHRSLLIFVYLAFFLFMVILLIRMIHYILPETGANACLHGWLSEHQLQAMDKLFFSGALGALVAKYLRIGATPPPRER